MDYSWEKLCGKALVWLAVEIMLNLTGMDNIADYSEFVFKADRLNSFSATTTVIKRTDAVRSSL